VGGRWYAIELNGSQERKNYTRLRDNWDHIITGSNCWNTDLLAGLAEVIPTTVLSWPKCRCCTDAIHRSVHQEDSPHGAL